ncbi:hypothetical protein ACK31A_08145, partial [Aeromonas caviae]
GVFGDNQFTSTLSVNFHFPRIPRRTFFMAAPARRAPRPKADPCHIPWRRPFNGAAQGDKLLTNEG